MEFMEHGPEVRCPETGEIELTRVWNGVNHCGYCGVDHTRESE